MKTIVINATALDQSGALTILKQFVEAIPVDEFNYLIFISSKINLSSVQPNVCLVPIDNVKSFRKRFIWDAWGLKRWLKNNKIEVVATLSLQNTNFRVDKNIPNFVYYHQPMPFFKNTWSLFKKEERPMWFYKYIYPFFVSLFLNKKTEVFVQLEFIKNGFAERFNFPRNKIHIITPTIKIPNIEEVIDVELETDKINLFYPATPFFYKNHKIILEALTRLNNNKFVLYLTCQKEDLNIECDKFDVRFMGVIPFSKVLGMYLKSDALVFPSYIETYGLPLIEAASFGTSILAADLPYSREVLKGYEGVEYIDHTNPGKWAFAIEKLEKGKKYKPYTLPESKSWQELFRIITKDL